jgi:ABC-type polysaccharide/polyol phosphate export systems, permease component
MNKKLKTILIIFAVVFSLAAGFAFANLSPIRTNFEDLRTLELTENVNSTKGLNNYVTDIKLYGIETSVGAIYIGEGETLTRVPFKAIGSSYFITLNRFVDNLNISVKGEDKADITVGSIVVNPRTPKYDITATLAGFFVIFIVVALVYALVKIKTVILFLQNALRFRSLLYNLTIRDLKVKYRRSVLGVLWSVLNPLLMMAVLTVVFSQIFRFGVKDFPVFYITGTLIFNFFSESTGSSVGSVIGGASLIKKVYMPKYIFPLEKCVFAFVNMLFSLIATAIVYIVLGVDVHWTLLMFPIPMLYTFVFCLGLSLILAAYTVFFRDIIHLYGVLVTVWMYLTPIIYPVTILPIKVRQFISLNPMYHYVTYARDVMIDGKLPSLETNIICIGFAVLFLAIGIAAFRKKQDNFILHI